MKHQPLDIEAVQELAAERGIDSVSELARRCGLDQSYMARILRGDRPAQPSLVLKLTEVLGVDRDQLLQQAELA